MTNTKAGEHTQGEWTYLNHNVTPINAESERFIIVANNKPIAAIRGKYEAIGFGLPFEECEANAKLIAAAPAMLEALQAIIQYDKDTANMTAEEIKEYLFSQFDTITEIARLAIEQATK